MITIETILCPVDTSEISRAALDYAVALAGEYDATLRVLEVAATPDLPAAVTPAAVTGLTMELRKALVDELEQFVQPALAAGVPTEIRLEEGYPVAQILADVESMPADLVVMGTHGRRGFDRFGLGSVAEKVLRKASRPVLTVPPTAHRVRDGAPLFSTILCATDFSAPATTAVEYAVSLADHVRARLILLHVLDWFVPPALRLGALDDFRRDWERDSLAQLRDLVPSRTREACLVDERLASGEPRHAILRVAAETSADLIVLGVSGHTALDRAVLGSSTHDVVRRATCPVLTVRLRPSA